MYNDIAEVSLIQPYQHPPPMMCKTMTARGAHPSRADPGVPSLGKLVYASSSVAQELLSSPSLPQACLSQIPASLCPPDYQLTKVVALPDPRHTLVMPLFRIAVALCGPSIIILSHPTYPPSSSSFPSRHILPKHHQALYTHCCLLPCDCALPANTIHQGRHSLQAPPSTAFLPPSRQYPPHTLCGPLPRKPLICSCYPAPPPSMRSPKLQSQNTDMPTSILQG